MADKIAKAMVGNPDKKLFGGYTLRTLMNSILVQGSQTNALDWLSNIFPEKEGGIGAVKGMTQEDWNTLNNVIADTFVEYAKRPHKFPKEEINPKLYNDLMETMREWKIKQRDLKPEEFRKWLKE